MDGSKLRFGAAEPGESPRALSCDECTKALVNLRGALFDAGQTSGFLEQGVIEIERGAHGTSPIVICLEYTSYDAPKEA